MTAPVIFIKKKNISYSIPVVEDGSAEAAQVVRILGDRSIKFRHNPTSGMAEPKCSFTTDNPIVIRYLHKWNKINKTLVVDTSMQPLRCHLCDFETVDGSQASRDLLATHILEHVGEDDAPGEEEISLEDRNLAELKELAAEAGHTEEEIKPLNSKAKVIALIKGESE